MTILGGANLGGIDINLDGILLLLSLPSKVGVGIGLNDAV